MFQNFVVLTTSTIAYMIPDMPRKLREQVRREAYLTNEIVLKTELEIAKGEDGLLTEEEMRRIRRRVRGGVRRADSAPAPHDLLDEIPPIDDESAV